MPAYDSANAILQDVAAELALSSSLTDGMGAADENSVQLRALLKRVGRGLVRKHSFLQQRRDYEFTTTTDSTYPLPADCLAMVDDTGWNHSQTRPLTVLSAPDWARIRAEEVGYAYAAVLRPGDGILELWPQPTASGERITFEYRSKYWVRPVGQTSATLEAPLTGTDILTIDAHLLTRALKHAWLSGKGFDANDAYEDLRDALDAELGLNVVYAPVLSLNGGPLDGDPLIGIRNLPTGGYGGGGLLDSGGLY